MDSKSDSIKQPQPSKRKADEESDDEVGPTGPPKQARVIGPALPPQLSAAADSDNQESSEDESSDDDFGPRLPSSSKSASATTVSYKETPTTSLSSVPDKTPTVSGSWMTISPEDEQQAGGLRAPPKLKARGFQTGRAARTSTTDTGGGVSQPWAETAEEKRIRLENEIMGIKTNLGSTNSDSSAYDAAAKAKKLTKERMREFNEKTSRESLYAAKKRESKDPTKEDDDPSARPFDKEKDIGGSRTITNSQHRQMLNQASKYDSRFTKGSFL